MCGKKLFCEKCNSIEKLQFSTGDCCDGYQSMILCENCTNKELAYAARRGYNFDYNECVGDPYCKECEEENLENLRIFPSKDTTNLAKHVRCLDCLKNSK
jgi:hypothetical protein